MVKLSAANTTAIRLAEQGSAPATPASGFGLVYVKSDGLLYWKDDAGTEHAVMDSNDPPPAHTHAAADLTSGTLATARLGSGTANSGTFLRGDQTWAAAGGGSTGLYTAYICIRDEKASGTAGGTFTSGAWRTRDLTTEHADTGNHASVASNQITLAAGTYRCLILCPAYAVVRNQARLQNITDGTTLLEGQVAYASFITSAADAGISAVVAGRFTLAATKVLEVQHRCQTTQATFGMGVSCSFGTEIYTSVELFKEAV